MKRLLVGVLSASALVTTLLLVRQQRDPAELRAPRLVPGEGESAVHISLERLREVGF